MELLFLIGCRLFVTPEDFERYDSELRNHSKARVPEAPAAPAPLSMSLSVPIPTPKARGKSMRDVRRRDRHCGGNNSDADDDDTASSRARPQQPLRQQHQQPLQQLQHQAPNMQPTPHHQVHIGYESHQGTYHWPSAPFPTPGGDDEFNESAPDVTVVTGSCSPPTGFGSEHLHEGVISG